MSTIRTFSQKIIAGISNMLLLNFFQMLFVSIHRSQGCNKNFCAARDQYFCGMETISCMTSIPVSCILTFEMLRFLSQSFLPNCTSTLKILSHKADSQMGPGRGRRDCGFQGLEGIFTSRLFTVKMALGQASERSCRLMLELACSS